MNDIRGKLLAAFQIEHREQLEAMRLLLVRLEQGTATAPDLHEIFRQAHSLRAAARACDFATIETLGKHLENVFAQLRKGTVRPEREVLQVVRATLNAVEDWCRALTETGTPPPEPTQALVMLEQFLQPHSGEKTATPAVDPLTTRLLEAFQIEHKEHLESVRAILAEFEQQGVLRPPRVDEAFRRAHSLKGAARIAELHGIETLAHRLETLFARLREKSLTLDVAVVRAVRQALDTIEDLAAVRPQGSSKPDNLQALQGIERVLEEKTPASTVALQEPPPPEMPPPTVVHAPVETVRISADTLDQLLRSASQLLSQSPRQARVATELTSLTRQLSTLEKEWEAIRSHAGPALRQLTETPELGRIARYLNLVELQVRSVVKQTGALRRLQQHNAWQLQLLSEQLRQNVRRVRMVSADTIFQGFRKMMRDLARQERKEIEFRVTGFESEADRLVLQTLKDPLMHILCNALIHGIEAPEERRRGGKPTCGTITLTIESIGNRLRIEVADDGRGIAVGKVAEVAVRHGLLAAAESASAEELARLLFRPGFSTAETVTGLAGRGMGLSVVQEAVARLQGEVHLQPGATAGTVLVIAVPISLSTQRLLLVSCAAQRFAVPLHAIQRLLRIKLNDLETVEGKPVLVFEEQPLPLLLLSQLLALNHDGLQGDFLPVMVLRCGSRRVAVIVDAFVEERDSLIHALDAPARFLPKFSGGILLEDGSVALVLNPTELVLAAPVAALGVPVQAVSAVKKSGLVLVVDDSLTTRTLEKSILEAHGYQVRIAVDGMEALAHLREELVDLVITDVEMPRMDGFALLEQIKLDPRLAQIPVIVVTSLARREDQERGLALGADAYIVKRKFDHEDLLATIRQIL